MNAKTTTTKKRFTATEATIKRDLLKVVNRMGATSFRYSVDLMKPFAAEIVFDRAGQRYVFRCDRYATALENLRAAQLTITYLWRAFEEYGVSQSKRDISEQLFAQFFLGFTPAPDDKVLMLGSGRQEWYEVLGVPADASRSAITNAYRVLAKTHHPDYGGDAEAFKRLRDAYDAGIKGVK